MFSSNLNDVARLNIALCYSLEIVLQINTLKKWFKYSTNIPLLMSYLLYTFAIFFLVSATNFKLVSIFLSVESIKCLDSVLVKKKQNTKDI